MQAIEAEVRLHGVRVGALRYAQGGSMFGYEADTAGSGHWTLGQTFEDDPRSTRRARVGVPPWFANLLPEGAMRRHIVSEMGGGNIGDFTLLTRLGRYLPGAVSVHADIEADDDLAVADDEASPDHPLRHSLAGVQLKATVPTARIAMRVSGDGGWWVAKLPDRSLRNLTENEYITMRWLAAASFDVPPIHLVPAGKVGGIPEGIADPNEPLYLIERFDRTREGRVHVEDFAQVADVDPRHKYSESGVTYDSLGRAISRLTGQAGYLDYIRRLVAMVITGNSDAHLKNWALRYADGRTPSLAPVYDFHSLTIYTNYRYSALALSLNAERLTNSVDVEDFRRLADACEADDALTVDTVARAVHDLRTAWHDGIRDEATRLFDALAEHYTYRLDTLPLGAAA